MRLRTISEALKKTNEDYVKFLSDKSFKNKKSKIFLFHGTKVAPEKLSLKGDYDWSDSNDWGADLPDGCLFLTTDIGEASGYGKFVIPCELKKYDHVFFQIDGDNPSQVFDDDYGISIINRSKKHFGFWEKFEDSGKSALMIKGKKRSTIITYIENVILRTDLAKEFYSE